VLSHVIGVAYYLLTLPTAGRTRLCAAWERPLRLLARRHWHYPAYSAPAALLQSAAQFLPAVLVAALYGPGAAGWFGLAQWTLDFPARLLSGSASAVYLGEARGLDPAALRRLFLRTARHFAVIGLLGMAPLVAFGPALFALVFGETWRPAGEFVQCLIPVQLVRFVVIPISQTLNVLQRQDLHLLSAGLNIAALGLAFGLGYGLGLPALTTLLLFSLGSAAAYLVYLGLTWRTVLRSSAAQPAVGTRPPPA
jgi:O-antigen/teichoic acid export membrane protein